MIMLAIIFQTLHNFQCCKKYEWHMSVIHIDLPVNFHVEISCCHHVHLHRYIYITIMKKKLQLFQKIFHVKCCSTYAYKLSSLMILTISWTIPLPCITYLFSTLPLMFFLLFSKCIYLSLSASFWYHVLLNALCLNLLHKSTLVCHTCTYTMTYNVWHLHLIYIWDIYPSMNYYWLIHFTTYYYCHSQTNTTVHNWYMLWNQMHVPDIL